MGFVGFLLLCSPHWEPVSNDSESETSPVRYGVSTMQTSAAIGPFLRSRNNSFRGCVRLFGTGIKAHSINALKKEKTWNNQVFIVVCKASEVTRAFTIEQRIRKRKAALPSQDPPVPPVQGCLERRQGLTGTVSRADEVHTGLESLSY